MANFFIDRPIFAWVIALLIMLGGGLSIKLLPIAQYPTIAPPAIDINATYPGASPKTLENTVTQVIEQKMIGIDNLRYFASTSDSVGNVTVTLTFNPGTDPDVALMQIQSKLQLATPLLPPEVQQQGLRLVKSGRNYLMILAFVSTDGSMTRNDLADFIASNVQEPLSRAKGVGDTQLFGAQYAMRVWVNMDKLNSYNLTITDVENALKEQNSQSSAGQLGGTPAAVGQQINAPLLALTRLENPEQFGHILLRVNADGSQVRLRDVSRIELGGETYENVSFFNGQPAGGIAIKLATNANAIETAQAVRKKIEELSKFFPKGVKVEYAYDIAPFVKISIIEVFKTLGEAIVLVFLVMYLFLQNIRATIIPTIAVPVVLLGTFGVLAIFGYSINTLTMF
ncbi:MAG: multidrug efflux RND transporter permease subunit, partial [Caedimonadaceae bacterium]